MSTPLIRENVGLKSRKFRNIVLPLFGKDKSIYCDYTLWNANFIDGFKQFSEFEFHVVTPHNGLKQDVYHFQNDNICYHVYRTDSNLLVDFCRSLFQYDKRTDFKRFRMKAKAIIDRINRGCSLL